MRTHGAAQRPRLVIVNNMPSFYRTAPFSLLLSLWRERTGGPATVLYQVRRDPGRRGEHFFTADPDLPQPSMIMSPSTVVLRGRRTYPLRFGLRLLAGLKPTHMLVAGWDSPLALSCVLRRRLLGGTICLWVESTLDTGTRRGRFSQVFRREVLRAADVALVPTLASRDFVHQTAGRPVPVVLLPNPVNVSRLPDPTGPVAHRRLVFLGEFSRRKGFDIFLAAVEAGYAEGWTGIAFGGDGRDDPEPSASGATLLPARPLGEIVPLLSPDDVLVIPSRVDPAPLTFSEGLALGLRVVVSDGIAYGQGRLPAGTTSMVSGDPTSLLSSAASLMDGPRPTLQSAELVAPQAWAVAVCDALLWDW